jgi:ribosomal protein S18 acetylase RimI-like enzyme
VIEGVVGGRGKSSLEREVGVTASGVVLRPFRNGDPPELCRLWDAAGLGPTAARRLSPDELDFFVLSQLHFDPRGLIVAEVDDRIVGWVHACPPIESYGWEPRGSQGVISLVMVHPQYRRRGIGRQLVDAAAGYLCALGCREVLAGESPPTTPFYLGLYGSASSAGFLSTEDGCAAFFQACGFGEYRRWQVWTKSLERANEPFDPRVMTNRRRCRLEIDELPPRPTARWISREGRWEGAWAGLIAEGDPNPVASCTIWPMRTVSSLRGEHVAGITELFVPPPQRRKAFAKTLLIEVLRHLRSEQFTQVELVVPVEDTATKCLVQLVGFGVTDTCVVYYRRLTEIVTPGLE